MIMSIVFYKSAKCRREFHNLSEAEECENKHLTIKEAHIKSYGIYPYPYKIGVIFRNGDTKIYVAEHLR